MTPAAVIAAGIVLYGIGRRKKPAGAASGAGGSGVPVTTPPGPSASTQAARLSVTAAGALVALTPLAPLAPFVAAGVVIGGMTQANAPSTRLVASLHTDLERNFAAWIMAGNVDPSWSPEYTASIREWARGVVAGG